MFNLFTENRVAVSKKQLDEILDYFHDQIEVLANENNMIKKTYKKDTDALKLRIGQLENQPPKVIIKYVKR